MPSVFIAINAAITAFISLAGTISNSLIIYTFIKTKSLRTVNNTFLFQLATIDLTKSVMILSIKSYKQFTDKDYVLGIYCPISGFLSTLTFVQSAILLAAIAVVRYFKIIRPMVFNRVFSPKRMVIYFIGIFLATSTLAMLPILGVGEYVYSKHHGVCFTQWKPQNVVFRSIFYVYTMGICYPVLIFCYTRIFTKLRRHKNAIKNNIHETPKVSSNNLSGGGMETKEVINLEEKEAPPRCSHSKRAKQVGEDIKFVKSEDVCGHLVVRENTQRVPMENVSNDNNTKKQTENLKRKMRNEIRVTKVMFIIVVAYSFCWLPAFFVNIFEMANIIKVSDAVLYTVITLLDSKVFLNPLIYGLYNFQFRQGLQSLLFRNNSVEQSNREDRAA